MTYAEALMSAPDGRRLPRVLHYPSLCRVCITAACFANARGGFLVIGVKDRTVGAPAFEGTSLDAKLLLRRIYALPFREV
jgi:predicted HTH transcriptional regulator